MPGIRCYFSPAEDFDGQQIRLDDSESRHLLKVRRARTGEELVVFDGEGNQWQCRLAGTDHKIARLAVLSHRRAVPPPCTVTLAQALPKGKVMERIVQKASELGTWRIQPLATDHCEAGVNPSRREFKLSRWRKIAIEACKQSGNPFLPRINPPMPLAEFCSSPSPHTLKLLASLDSKEPARQLILDKPLPTEAIWLIGPEGDLTGEEYAIAYEHGFKPVSLGPNVLRVETAVTVALGILQYALSI